MKKEFSLEEKMSAIGFVFQGESARSVSRRLHLGHHILYEWIERYKLLGIEGLKLKSKKKKRLSYEEKCHGDRSMTSQLLNKPSPNTSQSL